MQQMTCRDIEVRVAKIAYDKGRKTGCQLKLYRNGTELPTARNIWVDFVIINDENTAYRVERCTELDGTAYDVVIADDKGRIYYDGWKKRMRQTDYAQKHGLSEPADTAAINLINERLRKDNEAHRLRCFEEEKPKTPIISEIGRRKARAFIAQHPKRYNERSPYSFSDRELKDVLLEMREIYN